MPKKLDMPMAEETVLPDVDNAENIVSVLSQLGDMISSLNDKLDATLLTVVDEIASMHKELNDINAAIFDTEEEEPEEDLVEEDQEDQEETEEDIEPKANILPDIGIPCIPKTKPTGKTPGCTDILNPCSILTTLSDFQKIIKK